MTPWREHPLVLEGQLALGGPLGGAGLALDYSINDWLAVNAGVGVGSAAHDSSLGQRLQYAATARFRLPASHLSRFPVVGVEAGLSEGSFKSTFGCLYEDYCVRKAWKHVLWVNTNVFLESRAPGIRFRGFAGVAVPLASQGTANCGHESTSGEFACIAAPTSRPPWVINLGFAVGLPIL